MQITHISNADVNAVSQVLSLCINDAKREVLEYLQNPNVKILCAKQNQTVVGAICFLQTLDSADVLDIAVLPCHQRKGIGSLLLDACVDYCKQSGVDTLFLEVRCSNITAQKFYEAFGFEEISQRKNYYTAPKEDALIYRRTI